MLREKLSWVACAVLFGSALALPALAEDRTGDFESLDVRKIVSQARKDVADGALGVPGTKVNAPQGTADGVERRIVVFHKNVGRSRRMNLVRNTGGIPTKDLWLINAVAVVAPRVRMANFERRLAALSEVKRIEKDFVQNWLLAAPAPYANALTQGVRHRVPAGMDAAARPLAEPPAGEEGQTVPWGIERVNAQAAWAVTRGAGVKVAVVDTGIDFDHPDLKVAGGYNAIDPEASYKDDNGHGTHVAGSIAAQDNDQGVVGIAPDVQLYGVKVLSASGGGTFADVIEGIQWTVEHGMDIANFSLGASRGTEALADAVKAAKAGGVAIIAAAGNSGRSVGFPAAYPEVLAVAASDSRDGVARFSSRGPEVDVIAPGVGIRSTYMGGGYRNLSGTSMACPHVAGLAALAVARGVGGIDAVRAALASAATKIPEVPAEQQGAGLVDAERLVNNADQAL